jgi:hypothetical protein
MVKDKHSYQIKVLYLYYSKWINWKSETNISDFQKLETKQKAKYYEPWFKDACNENTNGVGA